MNVNAVAATSFPVTSLKDPAVRPVQDERGPDRGALQDAVDRMNAVSRWFRGSATYRIDEDSHRIVVKIVDRETGELIRQIPSEMALRQAEVFRDVNGLFYDHHA